MIISASRVQEFYIRIIAVLALLAASVTHADDRLTYGIGMGAMYSGLGANVGLQSNNDFRYLTAGCIALGYSDANGDSITPCGVGAGWIWTNLLSNTNNRHGLGFYVGPVGLRDRTSPDDDWETVYGAGLSYTYFFREIRSDGWNLGTTLAAGDDDGVETYLMLQAGYQF